MLCLYPRENGQSCGQCMACRLNDQMAWKFRLKWHLMSQDLGFWLTLQYDEEHLPRSDSGIPVVCKLHCQNFFRQLRKRLKNRDINLKISYFLTSEYGPQTHRPHYHCLLMFKSTEHMDNKQLVKLRTDLFDYIKEAWYHGFVLEKKLHNGVISYLTKYCLKESDSYTPPVSTFRLISKGIGEYYIRVRGVDDIIYRHFQTPEGNLSEYYVRRASLLYLRNHFIVPDSYDEADDYRANLKYSRLSYHDNKVAFNYSKLQRYDNVEDYFKAQEALRLRSLRIYKQKYQKKYG